MRGFSFSKEDLMNYIWTPASINPEESDEYLVTILTPSGEPFVGVDYYSTKYGWSAEKPTAWVNMPKPYKGDDSVGEE